MDNIKVLCVNAYPIASDCPIGYMTEHMFEGNGVELFELYTADCNIQKNFSIKRKISTRKAKVFVIKEKNEVSRKIEVQRKNFKFRGIVKEILALSMPVFLENKLESEIDMFSPQIIYTQGYSTRILKLVHYIAKKKNIPVIVHTLDYWFSNNKFIFFIQKKMLKKVFSFGSIHLGASPKMVRYLESEFKVKTEFITNCTVYNRKIKKKLLDNKTVFRIGYIGNLTPNRYKTINSLSNTIEKMQMLGVLKLVVYAPKNQIETYKNLMNSNIEFHFAVTQNEISEVYNSFDFLLHVESFEQQDIEFTKFSLSTKIAECFCTNVPLIYFGPDNIGVGDFLLKEQVAVVCHDEMQVINAISDMCSNSDMYEKIADKQYECGLKYFDRKLVQERISGIFRNVVREYYNTVHYISFYLDLEEEPCRKLEVAAQSKIRYIADSIIKAGGNLKIISTAFGMEAVFRMFPQKIIQKNDYELHYYLRTYSSENCLLKKFVEFYIQIQILKYLLMKVKKNDKIVVYHSPLYIRPLKIFKKFRKNCFVLEFNDLYQLHFTKTKDIKRMKRKEENFLKVPDKFILASPFMKEIVGDNVEAIINYGSYEVDKSFQKERKKNNAIIIYTGVVENLRKAAFYVAESGKYLPDGYEILIAGYGTSENIDKLCRICAEVNIAQRRETVKYVGCLNKEELSELMEAATIAVNAHTYAEGEEWKSKYSFPSKIPLNMAKGLYVLTYPYEIITTSPLNEACLFFEQLDSRCIAEAIIKACQNIDSMKVEPKEIIRKLDEDFVRNMRVLLGINEV